MNYRVLDAKELNYLMSYYIFDTTLDNGVECVTVSTTTYPNRVIKHSTKEPFVLSTKFRKISICPTAISIWKNYFVTSSLIEIQNAINMLKVTYQDIGPNSVREAMRAIRFKYGEALEY